MVRPIKRRRLSLPQSNLGRLFAALICLVVVVAGLELTNTTHLLHKGPLPTKVVVTAGKPVTPAQQSSASSLPTEKTPSSNTTSTSAGAVDTQGSAVPSTNSNQWVSSQSGYITVKSPAANSKLKDGSVVSGSAKVNEIHYRLVDNTVGVLAQGTLSVVGGDFSGTLHFQPKGTGGRVDIFSTDSQGVEYNEVQINVSFQQ